MKHFRQNRLIFRQFWRGGASSSATMMHLVLLAPEYVQKRRLSSLFCGCAPNFLQFNKSSCASARPMCKTDKVPAPLYPQRGRVSSLFCTYAANFRKLEKSPQRGSKSTKIWANVRKVLDIPTPRAAPRNSLTFFSRMAAKSFDNGCLW